jgi:hypothetical protein
MTAEPRLPAPWAALMMGWLTIVLLLDSHGSHPLQRILGIPTWLLLGVALTRVSAGVRLQALVVVGFATVVEFVASPMLGVYVYRFHNVPTYVPPGHGLVYLSAFALGNAAWVRRNAVTCTTAVVLVLGGWVAWGLGRPGRPDVLGALWFTCLLLFLWRGPSPSVYLGAAVVVSWLEVAGTQLGTWVWQPHDPTGLVSIGNPPTGAAGGYGWFDLAGLLVAPCLLGVLTRRRPAARPARVGGVSSGPEASRRLSPTVSRR